jgi:hypothetical protein
VEAAAETHGETPTHQRQRVRQGKEIAEVLEAVLVQHKSNQAVEVELVPSAALVRHKGRK